MGYQALLFSPDEKLRRIISQVFTELDFTVEPAYEPFGAVKNLMAQPYDAIVVDCDNEQNAALLFKSARNSSFNQSALAIAVVEGQAGVAKAYRIGANLVLTKPINVEQAKGTLRVARGLLRKNSDPAGGSATRGSDSTVPTAATPAPAGVSSQPASRAATAFTPPISRPDLLEFEARMTTRTAEALPHRLPAGVSTGVSTMSAPARVEDKPAVSSPTTQIRITMADEQSRPAPRATSPDLVKSSAVATGAAGPEAAGIASAPLATPLSASLAVQSAAAFPASRSAAAPAPAKEVLAAPPKENRKIEREPAYRSQDAAPMLASVPSDSSPLFAAYSAEEESRASGSNRKILVALIILALAALGYLVYGKLGTSGTANLAPPPVSIPHSVEQNTGQPAPALAPVSSPETELAPSTPDRVGPAIQTSAPKTAPAKLSDLPPAAAGNSPVIRIELDPGAGTSKPDPTPLLVRSSPAGTKTQIQPPESAPPLTNPLAIGSAAVTSAAVTSAAITSKDSALSWLLSSASSTPSKPSLATTRISQGVSQGLLIKRVQPKYPRAALSAHTQGAVQIEATIDKEGNVNNLKVLSGDPVLARAALEAVRQWRYKPYYLNGEPVEVETQVTINFKAN